MSDKKNEDKLIEHFLEVADKEGVAVATVSDGFVLMFKREHLQKLLDAAPNEKKVMIFVKQPQFKN